MAVVHLGLLLHFYQPPGQTADVLRRIAEESYRPLVRVFRAHEHARASFNVNGVLTEMLDDHGYGDVIEAMAGLAADDRIEFTTSGKYHPILPLAAPREAARQIALNNETNRRLFGAAYRPRGLFPPEMAWDPALGPLVREVGVEWVVMSGIACPAGWPLDRVDYQQTGEGRLALLFRDDILSNKIAFHTVDAPGFLGDLAALADSGHDRYVVIAMDAETFGHHIKDWERDFLKALFRLIGAPEPPAGRGTARPRPAVRPTTLSDIVGHFPAGHAVTPRTSSWSTTADDLAHGSPFPLWRHRANELHRLLWRHLEQALALYDLAERYAGAFESSDLTTARYFADIAQHSDPFWWASRRPHWSPTMVHRGLSMQRDAILNAVRAINLGDAPEEARRESLDRVAIARDTADRITDRLFWD